MLDTALSQLELEEPLSEVGAAVGEAGAKGLAGEGPAEDVRQQLEEAGQLLRSLYERLMKAVTRTEDQLEETKARTTELEHAVRDLEQQQKRPTRTRSSG